MERARLRPGRTGTRRRSVVGRRAHRNRLASFARDAGRDAAGEPAPLFRVAGRILRCHVALLDRERIRYRGALMFDEQLPFWEVATQGQKPLT